MPIQPIRLIELNAIIKNTLQNHVVTPYWITCEISELKSNASGHCYLEVVEKDEKRPCIIAKAKATIWSSNYRMIKPYFETTTGTSLCSGIKVLVKVVVEFHELYGLNLNIIDIEPSFTVGELARRKKEIIKKLTEEGVMEINKELSLSRLPNRVAIISSSTAAGYGDFINQLIKNVFGYRFYVKLFPAFMQGDGAEQSIIKALERIHNCIDNFDVVVMIRGGGSQADLDCYNSYWLSLHVAQFPLPVLTGIGHEQDECIVDLVAHTSLKTPTAVAEFLIGTVHEEEINLNDIASAITDYTKNSLSIEKEMLARVSMTLATKTRKIVNEENIILEKIIIDIEHKSKKVVNSNLHRLEHLFRETVALSMKKITGEKQNFRFQHSLLKKSLKTFFAKNSLHLEILENKNHFLNPEEIMKRGYSITRLNNKVVKSVNSLHPDDVVENIFYDGKVKSKIIKED